MSIQTVSGHVSRALDFFLKDDLWFALGHPFNWNIARLTGYVPGDFTPSADHDFVFTISGPGGPYEITYPILTSWPSKTATEVRDDLNNLIFTASSGAIANAVSAVDNLGVSPGDRIRIAAVAPDLSTPPSLTIDSGSSTLGFLTGAESVAILNIPESISAVPVPNPLTRRLIEPFAFRKVSTKAMVVPNPDLPATMIGENQASVTGTFDMSSDTTLTFKVNNSADIVVNFLGSSAEPLANIVSFINDAATLISADFSGVADLDTSVTPNRLKLVAPTKGASSMIEIVDDNTPLGLPGTGPSIVVGVDGGSIKFRNDQYDPVVLGVDVPLTDSQVDDLYEQGARLVFIEAEFRYDELPLLPFAQVGVLTNVEPIPSLPGKDYLRFEEVDEPTRMILEFLDHRLLTVRAADQRDVLRLVLEF